MTTSLDVSPANCILLNAPLRLGASLVSRVVMPQERLFAVCANYQFLPPPIWWKDAGADEYNLQRGARDGTDD